MHLKQVTAATLLSFTMAISGCGDDSGEQEVSECDMQETSIGFDELSELGFSAGDVMAAVATSGVAQLEWEGAGETELNWEFSGDANDVRYVESVLAGDDSSDVCDGSYVAIGGIFELSSEDDALDETIAIDLIAKSVSGIAEFATTMTFGEIAGDLMVDDAEDNDLLQLEGQLTADGSAGTLYIDRYEKSDDGSTTDQAWQHLGSWESLACLDHQAFYCEGPDCCPGSCYAISSRLFDLENECRLAEGEAYYCLSPQLMAEHELSQNAGVETCYMDPQRDLALRTPSPASGVTSGENSPLQDCDTDAETFVFSPGAEQDCQE